MAKVLVVDDSQSIRLNLKETIIKKNHTFLEAIDGVEGLEMVAKYPDIALIFCDVNMPNMDGLTMCQTLHELDNSNRIPIVMLTTEGSADIKTQGKAAGVKAWIFKPATADKIKLILDTMIQDKTGKV